MTKKWQILFDVAFLILLGAVFYGAFLGSYHLITPDEGRYPEIAREMLASGHWITPRLNGIAFLDKPILYYWFEATMMKFFGVTEWSVRILPAFFGVVGSLFIYWAGRELYCRKTGLIAALILMTSLLYFMSAHYADMDLMVTVLISASLWLFIMAIQYPKGSRRRWYLWAAYAFAALSFLTKGMMGLVFPGMIILVWMLLLNNWKWLTKMYIPSGLLIFFLIIFPWLIMVQAHNPEFFYYFFVVQQFSRYLTSNFNMHQPLYYYVPVILLGLMPWTIFLFQALIAKYKGVKSHWKKSQVELFLLLWPALIFVFFSIPESKIVGYIIPVFPPLALIVASYLVNAWVRLPKSKGLKIAAMAYVFFAVLLSIGLIYTAHLPSLTTKASFPFLCAMSVVILAGSCLALVLACLHKKFMPTFLTMLLTTILFSIVTVASVSTYQLSNVKPLAMRVHELIKPNDIVVTYNKYYQDLPMYVHKRIYVVANWKSASVAMQDGWQRELAEGILYKHHQEPWLISRVTFRRLWQGKRRVFVLTTRGRAKEMKSFVGTPVYPLGAYDKTVLLSNRE